MIAENLKSVHTAMHRACEAAGRDPMSVKLCVVSKTYPAEAIAQAVAAGAVVFGENRVQELVQKAPLLPKTLEWHVIGHLQSNKVRKALKLAHTVQSVDSLELARDLSRIARELGRRIRLLFQVNIAQDTAKYGWETQALRDAMPELLRLPQLEIAGLMTIPEQAETAAAARPHFAALRQYRDELEQAFQHPLPELSMGMSGDFPEAISEGATMVRVGSRIFGSR
jgi:pyridoxal phosphate enzyme (YggS family)